MAHRLYTFEDIEWNLGGTERWISLPLFVGWGWEYLLGKYCWDIYNNDAIFDKRVYFFLQLSCPDLDTPST